MTASMFRDIKAGLPVEADHVIGDLVARADAAKIPVPKLRIAYTHLKAYEKQRGVSGLRSPDGAQRNPGLVRAGLGYPGLRFAPPGLRHLHKCAR